MTFGRVNPQFRLEDQQITGLGNVYYNLMEPALIETALKRGEGTLEGTIITEFVLEGYGPGGAAILVEVLSDNRNRAVQEVRSTFARSGGNLGESGSVAWLFDPKGLITVETKGMDVDELSLQAIDAGAEDVLPQSDYIEVYTKMEDMETVRKTLEANGVTVCSAELAKIPKNTIQLDEHNAIQILRLMEKLEDLDDTKSVCSNVDFPDEIPEKYKTQE